MKLLLLLSMISISLVGCKTVPKSEPFYEIVSPPSRPVLVQVMDEPIKGLTYNLNLLIKWGERWEAWYSQYKEYENT